MVHRRVPGPYKSGQAWGAGPPLAAPIRRIFYLSAEGTVREHEVFPPPNPRLLAQVESADAIVYGMGSLYTSICPSLVLKVSLPRPRIHPPLLSVPADKSAVRGGVTARHPPVRMKFLAASVDSSTLCHEAMSA